MIVHVEFMGPVLKPVDGSNMDMELTDGTTVQDLLLKLGYPPTQARHVAVYEDGSRLPHMALLHDGQQVTVAVAMGGG
jgi:sulfur carrier protein ThiS